ncbi:MAG TPA: NAD(P)H-dependent oxidoreductase [Planctomycetota bacterium]|nr:NAD(P)H-dependent oxidoreductase [Planctomycetota bacterium]
MVKILAFAGTTRTEALNKKLIRVAAAAAREAGAEVTLIDLRDFPMPLYDGDLEAEVGIPPMAVKFKELMFTHRGLMISTGEYNSSITGVLKNAIDWASRSEPGEAELACFKDKVAGLLSASPGMLGGMRAMTAVRSILGNIGVLVIPEQLALGRAHEAFEADGSLKDPKRAAAVAKVASALVRIVTKLS